MKLFVLSLALLSLAAAAEKKLGKPLTLDDPTPIPEVLANKERLAGKTVQVRGKVVEVCQMMGCWTMIADPETGAAIRVKVADGEIIFPKDGVGRMITAEGVLTRITLTAEQAAAMEKHEAEEQGRKYVKPRVLRPKVIYQIRGAGAVIEEE